MSTVEIASCPKVTSNGKEASYVLEVTNGFVEQFGITKEIYIRNYFNIKNKKRGFRNYSSQFKL